MTANNKPINAWLPSLAESVTSCPCPPEVSEHIPDTDKAETDGGILFFELHVDPDLPFCSHCELAQIDLPVLYSCQCVEV